MVGLWIVGGLACSSAFAGGPVRRGSRGSVGVPAGRVGLRDGSLVAWARSSSAGWLRGCGSVGGSCCLSCCLVACFCVLLNSLQFHREQVKTTVGLR